MLFPRSPYSPYPPYLLLLLADPEMLVKYIKISASALQTLRNKAKLKGQEHKTYLEAR